MGPSAEILYSPRLDRLIREALVWLNRHGCIVQRTPPQSVWLLMGKTREERHPRVLRRRFTTADAPQITGMLPGGRFFAVYCKRSWADPKRRVKDWLGACAALGGAAMIVSSLEELARAFEHVSEQRSSWVAPNETLFVPPPLGPGSKQPGPKGPGERRVRRARLDPVRIPLVPVKQEPRRGSAPRGPSRPPLER